MNLHRHRHFFIDVEAFGPPGQGNPFALACVPFTLRGDIGEGKQWNFQGPGIKHGIWESAERSTLRWLLSQPEAVRAQVNGDMPFELAYAQFRDMIQAEPGPVMLWSDDWSDFAWIDAYVRLWTNENVRELGCSADSTGLVRLAKMREPDAVWPSFEGTQHVALDDARNGARELCHAIALLNLKP